MKTRGLLLLLSLLLCLGLALCFVSCEEEAPTPEPPAPEAPEQPEDPEAPEEPGDEEPHEHSFGSWTVIKAATCGAQGRRMRLCACGEREYASDFATEEHLYGIENKCVVCGDVWEYYENLSYELNADGASYMISGFGGEIGEILALPCYYNGLPVTAIADEAFRGVDGLVELHLTDYVIHIGARAFENCAALNLILFEKNTHLGQIGERAFAGTAITAFEIPAGVLVIGDGAFAECRALEELTVAEGNSRYAISKSGCLVDLASMTLLRMGAQGVFSSDYTLTAIAAYAFAGCNADEVTIPASVIRIEKNAFSESGSTKVAFAKTEGWIVTESGDATDGVAVVPTADKAANLALLTVDYLTYDWYRVDAE